MRRNGLSKYDAPLRIQYQWGYEAFKHGGRFNNLNKDKRIELNERYKLKYSDIGANSIAEDEAYWFIDE